METRKAGNYGNYSQVPNNQGKGLEKFSNFAKRGLDIVTLETQNQAKIRLFREK